MNTNYSQAANTYAKSALKNTETIQDALCQAFVNGVQYSCQVPVHQAVLTNKIQKVDNQLTQQDVQFLKVLLRDRLRDQHTNAKLSRDQYPAVIYTQEYKTANRNLNRMAEIQRKLKKINLEVF